MFRVKPVLIVLALVLLAYTSADAFHAEILPAEINPGDAFLVKVTGSPGEPLAVSDNGRLYFENCGDSCYIAVGAVDVRTEPGVYEIVVSNGENKKRLELHVRHIEFPVRRLTLPEDKVTLSSENLKRVEKEKARLSLIWGKVSDRLWDGKFIMPLENSISAGFGIKRIMNRKKESIHRGIDIRGKNGEAVKAANTGRVVLAEELFFGGNTVIIDHGQGIYTVYMHLSKFNVTYGEIVSKGDIIGFVGSTGRATGPHLHFGVKVTAVNVNPVSFTRLPF
jgi:murein DD-endopeptidase MepM/ murein hydrolase activator NlpD